MRGFIPAAAVVALVALAPVVAAGGGGGPNGGWGKGLLSETLAFDCETTISTGYMYWIPEASDLIFDFHGYELEADVVYHLICFVGDEGSEPADFVELGAKWTCVVEDCYGVHIKGEVPWPGLTDATVCLVPDSYWQFGGDAEWKPGTYLVSVETVDL